jgi:hypothetical protein
MYAFCTCCRRVYDFLKLHRERPWRPLCPECDVPLRSPPARHLQAIRKRLSGQNPREKR